MEREREPPAVVERVHQRLGHRLGLATEGVLAPRGLDPAAEERDQLGVVTLPEVPHVSAQPGESGALGAAVILERLPLELDRLTGGRRAAPQHGVHPLDPTTHLVDPVAEMVGDLLHQRIAEHPALLGGEDLLAVGDLGLQRVQDLSERLLTAALGDVDEQQVVLAATRVGAHVGLRQLAVEQLHPALHLDPELAGSAANRQQLRRQRARDLERTGEGPS